MESPRERACPRCSAPAAGQQRWCLECGGELPGARQSGLRPAVGIATTLAVLVGAASAGGYTLMQEGKQPPPPATTVAQAPPASTPETLPPAAQEPLPTPAPGSPSFSTPDTPTASSGGSAQLPSSSSSGALNGGTNGSSTPSSDGSVEAAPEEPASTTPEPQFALTDIALGAAAVVYAPYAPETADLGDASRTVDGSTRTVWKAPAAVDAAASPQLGVYVDLAGKERIRKLIVRTPSPGMSIEVYGAVSGPPTTITDAGWRHLVDRADIGEQTTIKLPDQPFRYVLVWITAPPSSGARPAISELSLLSMQPE